VTPFADGLGRPVDLEVSRRGALYVLVIGNPGRVVRIRFTR
jgi:glucose/arabinose dehydrogenase